MKTQTVQRIVWAASIIGLAVDIAAIVIVVCAWAGLSIAFGTTTATALMIATLALQATFIIVQLFPNGRAMVPVSILGPDGWSFVIISTAIPGVLWRNLAALAIPAMRFMPSFATPLFTCMLLLIGREIQKRRMAVIRE